MCKIVSFAGITPETQKNAWKFILALAPIMSKVDDDGFGYAAFDRSGNLFGERWLNNKQAFKNRPQPNQVTEFDNQIINEFNDLLSVPNKEPKYNNFGELSDNICAITLHARMATSGKEFVNTHPFVEGRTSLIHNGVISNHHRLSKKHSSCDSEVILHEYIKSDVHSDINNFQKVAGALEGYYALGILTQAEDQLVMDIVKDGRASLSAAYVKELQTIVFATSLSHIFEAAKKCKFKVTSHYNVKENSIFRINALTGKVIQTASFVSVPATKYGSSYSDWEESRYTGNGFVKVSESTKATHTSQFSGRHADWVKDKHSNVWRKINGGGKK